MRALEFTRLTEDTVQNVDLNRIKSGKPVDPALQQVLATLQPEAEKDPRILNLIKQAVQKFTQKLKQVATAEAFESFELDEDNLGIRAINPQVTQQYDNMEVVLQTYLEKFGVKMNDPKVKSVRDELLRNLQDIQTREIKTARRAGIEKGYTAGQRKGEDEFKKWFQSIDQILIRLGKKAQGYTDPTAEDLKAMTAKERAGAKKVGINAEKFASDLGQSLKALFLNKIYGQEESTITKERVLEFLKAAENGSVINNMELVSRDHGNITDVFDDDYKDVLVELAPQLFKLKPPAAGSANIGPGELALAMLGNPSNKADKGDININGEMYEIKAGSGTVGGRFNSSDVGKAKEGWKPWNDGIKKIMGANYDPNQTNVAKSGKKTLGSKFNWNDSGVQKFNAEVGPYTDKAKTVELISNVMKVLFKNYKKIKNMPQYIDGMINNDGTINVDLYMMYWARALYDSYQEADGVTNILIINTGNLDYTIIRNSQDVEGKFQKTFRTSGGFNWNDGQQTASPQFVVKK